MWGEFKKLRKGMKQINSRVDRVILYHTKVTSTPSSGQNTETYNCSSLHEYWVEYNFGIGGNKPTSKYTKAERRLHKHAPIACERLEEVYNFDGRKSACLREIGKEMKKTPVLPKYFLKYPINN